MNKIVYLYIAGFTLILPQLIVFWMDGYAAFSLFVAFAYIWLSVAMYKKDEEALARGDK